MSVLYDDYYEEVLAGISAVGDEELLQFFRRVISDIACMKTHTDRGKYEHGIPADSAWRFAVFGNEIRERGLIEQLAPKHRVLLERG